MYCYTCILCLPLFNFRTKPCTQCVISPIVREITRKVLHSRIFISTTYLDMLFQRPLLAAHTHNILPRCWFVEQTVKMYVCTLIEYSFFLIRKYLPRFRIGCFKLITRLIRFVALQKQVTTLINVIPPTNKQYRLVKSVYELSGLSGWSLSN